MKETNFDGIVGPTHHYAGLALGNVASQKNAHRVSNPKAAALQGLYKMHQLIKLGIPQAVLPPLQRPSFAVLKNLGFNGKPVQMLEKTYRLDPNLLGAVSSASSMWVANAATVTSHFDSDDQKLHITPANLITHFHRAIESHETYAIFKKIFSNPDYFSVHKPLFSHLDFADEGAANHNRLCGEYNQTGFNVFVYNRSVKKSLLPAKNPARQTKEASLAIARLHQLPESNTYFIQQNPMAVDKGVFHNDVISVANQNVWLYHEHAFLNEKPLLKWLDSCFEGQFFPLKIAEKGLSVDDAVQSYLFNSQLLTLKKGEMAILAPIECQENKKAHRALETILDANNPIQHLYFADCRQSMLNGGGPACLRLRMVLTDEERQACSGNIFLNETLYQALVAWVEQYYRDRLEIKDLLDPLFLDEIQSALEALSVILKLEGLYKF